MSRINHYLYTKNFYRFVLAAAAILYILFGFLFSNLPGMSDPFTSRHRIFAALSFLALFILTFFSSWIRDRIEAITFSAAYLAAAQLIYVCYLKEYSFTLAISLIVVIAIVNLFAKGYKYILYINIVLAFFVLISLWNVEQAIILKSYYSLLYLITAFFSYMISYQKYFREKELTLNKERLELAVKAANLGIWDWNIKSGEVIYNEKWAEMLGYSLNELDKTLGGWRKLINSEDKVQVLRKLNSHLKGENQLFKSEYRLKMKSDKWKWVRDVGKVIEKNNDGEAVRALGVHLDIDEQKKIEKEIRYLSFHDELTGLYNRRYLNNELERLNNSRKIPISIIIGDLDKLKIVNDNHGHLLGDQYLKEAASILNDTMRSEDIVARTGGDEFSIILPETDSNDAEKICERIREGFKQVNQDKELPVEFSISLGIATLKDSKEDLAHYYNQADKAMYKNKGRNTI